MIEEASEATAEIVGALQRLVPQLSAMAATVNEEIVQRIVDSGTAHLLLARDSDGQIVGTLTLVVFPIPTGTRAWIEDVIVDSAARGQGIGKALTAEALRVAEIHGARTVDLTSRPTRDAANAMYRAMGFTERETRVYRYSP